MNIAEAKEYIKNTVMIYLKKNEFGDYRIPVVRQRPVFLLGAPGIGKTAIMEQIASELGIGLVSYSMTHHTRQSALGLPYIQEKEYGGERFSVSEYTMSEIIASIYETMESSGVREGILFLDEINCVSETLAPSMLQFLQYKVFGRHSVPEGWVIVTAGNPPEYNKSVREFDVVTMDRLKLIEVEADYPAWKKYAEEKGIHGSILNFLDIKRDCFYHMETTVDGRSYVTARGWEDLSDIIYLYEEHGLKVNESLCSQYLKNDRIVREFGAYYDLYNKYKQDYRIEALMQGEITESMLQKAGEAQIDERLSLVGLLLDKLREELKATIYRADDIREILPAVQQLKEKGCTAEDVMKQIQARKTILDKQAKAGSLTPTDKHKHRRIQSFYEKLLSNIGDKDNEDDRVELLTLHYNGEVGELKEQTVREQQRLSAVFEYVDRAFGPESNEMLVLVTDLTIGAATARFLSTFGSHAYEQYNDLLKVSDRREVLRAEIAELL